MKTICTIHTPNNWNDIHKKLGATDRGGRWFPHPGSLEEKYVHENRYRYPSRAYPWSYAKPLMTAKFQKWLAKEKQAKEQMK